MTAPKPFIDAPKLCKTCKFYERRDTAGGDRCLHAQTQRVDLVRGEESYAYCDIQRMGVPCGPDGKLWEAA